jgi:hypothetical protein
MVETRNGSQTTGDAQDSHSQRTSIASQKTPSEKDTATHKPGRSKGGPAEKDVDESKPKDDSEESKPLPSTELPDDGVGSRPTIPQKRGFEETGSETVSTTTNNLDKTVPSNAMQLDRRPTPGRTSIRAL